MSIGFGFASDDNGDNEPFGNDGNTGVLGGGGGGEWLGNVDEICGNSGTCPDPADPDKAIALILALSSKYISIN
jgi:hypothetical protein